MKAAGVVARASDGASRIVGSDPPFTYFKRGDRVHVHWPDGSFSDHAVELRWFGEAHVRVMHRGVRCLVPLEGLVVELEAA